MDYPVKLNIDYPEKLSRGKLFLRFFLAWAYVLIPHGFILYFLGIAVFFVQFIAWWAILFTGKYPKGMFNFVEGYWRWQLRVYAYMAYMTDKYPPFSLKHKDDNPVHFDIEYPEKLSRGLLFLRLFLGFFYIWIPHGLILYPLMMAVYAIYSASFWVILFTGKYPPNMFNFVTGILRWGARVTGYASYMCDKYPPFSDEG